jgi:hypothetical protein
MLDFFSVLGVSWHRVQECVCYTRRVQEKHRDFKTKKLAHWPEIPEDSFVFCSLNSLYKVMRQVTEIYSRSAISNGNMFQVHPSMMATTGFLYLQLAWKDPD